LDHANPKGLNLFAPGPVNPPPFVLKALGRPLLHHRSPEFAAFYEDLTTKLRALLGTSSPVTTLASSATGAMDAVVSSLFAAGDEVLVPAMGKFSGRWADICRAYGIKPHVMEIEPGNSPSAEDIRWSLVRNDRITGMLLTHCETSTGALVDLKGISEAAAGLEKAGRVILRIADCVSSFCVDDLKMDEWGLDCVITASQKGLLSPAGLSIVAVGGRAASAMERVPARGFYTDLRKYFARSFRSSTPFTPALSLLYAVGAAVERINEVGLENVLDWNRRAARAVMLALEDTRFEALAANQSSAVIAFKVGEMNAERICDSMEEQGIYLARGQGKLHGNILRISPIGKTRREIIGLAGALVETVAGSRKNEAVGLRIAKLTTRLEDLLKGRDVWA
jgi:aspartate aminotransferase-like enzyme